MTDERFYHYTDIQAALSILTSAQLWFTDYRFLNDRHELTSAIHSLKDHAPPIEFRAFSDFLRIRQISANYCVLSLSKSPQILSQWRAYSRDGTGIAIGVNRNFFMHHTGLEIIDCTYQEHNEFAAHFYESHKTTLKEIGKIVGSNPTANDIVAWLDANTERFDSMIRKLLSLKNPAFAEEQEVRAVFPATRDQTGLRTSRDQIVPYATIQLYDAKEVPRFLSAVFDEIWLGPKCSEQNSIALQSATFANLRIRRFDCGYV